MFVSTASSPAKMKRPTTKPSTISLKTREAANNHSVPKKFNFYYQNKKYEDILGLATNQSQTAVEQTLKTIKNDVHVDNIIKAYSKSVEKVIKDSKSDIVRRDDWNIGLFPTLLLIKIAFFAGNTTEKNS